MPELHFSLSFRFLLLLAAGLCSFAGAWFVYRTTIPPVSSTKRSILIILRGCGLLFVFLVLGEPLLSLITHTIDPPATIVLVDNSLSMKIKDRTGQRDETLKSILHSPIWHQIGAEGKLDYALFDGKVRTVHNLTEDSLTLHGEMTDIAHALHSIKQTSASSNLQAVVLITDGNSTTGMNPIYDAEDLDVPVFTIGIGDTSDQKDFLIRKVLTNEITYIGTKVPVNVIMHSSGFSGERVVVSLRSGTTVLDEKSLILESGSRDYLIPLTLVPENEGIQKFTVETSHLPGELVEQNNRMSFFIKVLKSKMHLILIAGSPNQDVACIRNVLTNDKNIELQTYIEHGTGQFSEGDLAAQELTRTDCLLLVGFPSSQSSLQNIQAVLDAADKGKPLFTLLSRTMDYNRMQLLNPVLPFHMGTVNNQERQIFVRVSEDRQNTSLLKIVADAGSINVWSQLPPVFQVQGNVRAKVESEVLATVRYQSMLLNDPFIVQRKINKKRSLSVLGYGIWRWKMMSSPGSGAEKVLEHFLSSAIRWLTTQEDARKIVVQPTKRLSPAHDPVEFTAQVYDDTYQPIDGAQIEVRVRFGNEIFPLILNSLGSGQYQGAYDQLQEGEYSYTASVKFQEASIGGDQGTFSVGGLNAEYLETRMNKQLLQQIAVHTGGKYYESNEFVTLSHDIAHLPQFKPRDVRMSVEYELWNSRWMLTLVLLIFSLEWFLRKWNGML
jgi:hypothetical protein